MWIHSYTLQIRPAIYSMNGTSALWSAVGVPGLREMAFIEKSGVQSNKLANAVNSIVLTDVMIFVDPDILD